MAVWYNTEPTDQIRYADIVGLILNVPVKRGPWTKWLMEEGNHWTAIKRNMQEGDPLGTPCRD